MKLGEEASVGEDGTIYFSGGAEFEYHNDPDKTASSRNAEGWSTLGDIGRLDEDGFLYLTDRKSYMTRASCTAGRLRPGRAPGS